MVTIQTADSALKSYYLDAVAESLNMKANPLLAQIKRTTSDIVGKDVKKLVRYGVNGGIGAGTEDGNLPGAIGNNYEQFTVGLKNLYGTLEISDKALRASQNNEGAFVNLLNDEMKSLVDSSAFNLGRMLYGDGTGKLGTVASLSSNVVTLDTVNGIFEGMAVDFYTSAGVAIVNCQGRLVSAVDRANKTITIAGATLSSTVIVSGVTVHLQGSYGKEITGLGAIFSSSATLYGATRSGRSFMTPYSLANAGYISDIMIQTAIDSIEEASGSKVNFIVCSWGVRRALQDFYTQSRTFVPMREIEGGVEVMTFNGIPVVADRFCPEGTMYLLNTDDFCLHQLCDWQWLEGEDGKILKQVPGKPVYTATLVKYAELLCSRPAGQGVITGITES